MFFKKKPTLASVFMIIMTIVVYYSVISNSLSYNLSYFTVIHAYAYLHINHTCVRNYLPIKVFHIVGLISKMHFAQPTGSIGQKLKIKKANMLYQLEAKLITQ